MGSFARLNLHLRSHAAAEFLAGANAPIASGKPGPMEIAHNKFFFQLMPDTLMVP